MLGSAFRLTALLAAATLVSGGAARAAGAPLLVPAAAPALQGPVIIAGYRGGLEYWPLGPKGSKTPTQIKGLSDVHTTYGLAAAGQHVVIADGNKTVVFDLRTQHETVLPDTTGFAADVAIGKNGAIYVANIIANGKAGDVLVYPENGNPYSLECGLLKEPAYIALDNEGNVFLNDVVRTQIVEIPVSGKCAPLALSPGESGYAAGVAIDPKTDDLLVLDDPDYCAGGIEGRLTTYRKPYEKGIGRSLDLGYSCSGSLRLNADSSLVFIGDQDVSAGRSFILQRTYPEGKALGSFFGGSPYGFTTIPNRLPN